MYCRSTTHFLIKFEEEKYLCRHKGKPGYGISAIVALFTLTADLQYLVAVVWYNVITL